MMRSLAFVLVLVAGALTASVLAARPLSGKFPRRRDVMPDSLGVGPGDATAAIDTEP